MLDAMFPAMNAMNDPATPNRIMIVDDTPANLALLQDMLRVEGREVVAFPGGLPALLDAQSNPPDLILLDVNMPGMDGYQVLRQLKENARLREIPVILLNSMSHGREKIRAFRSGGVDYLPKPFQQEEVLARVEAQLTIRSLREALAYQGEFLERLVKEKLRDVSEAQLATIFALAKMAESRDDDSGNHLERVRGYCLTLATRLGEASHLAGEISEEFVRCLHHAAPLHDIGKVAIPDRILLKRGPLTGDQTEIMQTHTVIGAENLRAVCARYPGNAFLEMGIEIARHHHEWWDGSGYPDRLAGNGIPLAARIVALADCYDALCTDRCYRGRLTYQAVKGVILAEKGTHFDPVVVDAFVAVEGTFREIMESLS